MTLRAVFMLLCSAIVTSHSAQAQSSKKEKTSAVTLFTVNKKPVTAEEFIYLYKKNHHKPDEDFTRRKIEEYLSLYINFKLKVEEARKRGMDTTNAFKKEFNQYKEELRKPYLPGKDLSDSLARMTYERMKEEVKAAHILVSVSPDAAPEDTLRAYNHIVTLRSRILAGEDFNKIAAEFSEDPSAKMNYGDLGYFTALQMVYPFENAAYSTPVGEVSTPIRTRFGYHILKVSDRRPAGGEVEVAHIMIKTGEHRDDNDAKNQIFAIYDQLQAGLAWADLCRQHSEDLGTRESGGKLRPFRAGMMSNVPEFEKAAFELEKAGQYSDPFKTQYGWHIVRLERKIPLGSYDEMASSLKNRVSRDERTQISKQALQQRLRRDYNFQENEPVRSALFNLPDSTLERGKWRKKLNANTLNSTLFELNKKVYKVSAFMEYADKNPVRNAPQAGRTLQNQYDQFVDESILQMQEAKITANHPEYGFLLNEYYEGILLFEIMEKEVWNKASADSLGQHNYFVKNAAKYTAGPRVRATIYSASDPTVLMALKEILLDEDQPGKVHQYVNQNKIRSESGYYEKKDKAILGKIPWENGFHQTDNNGIYYLAWLKEVLPEGRMSFEEARPDLISDYQSFLEENWVSELRKKYPVKFNAKGKTYIFGVLEKH